MSNKRCAIRKTLKSDGTHPLPHQHGEIVAIFEDYEVAREFIECYWKIHQTMPYHVTTSTDID